MGRHVVHGDDVARFERRDQHLFERRDQHLFDIGEERLAGHRTVEHHRRAEAVAPQRGDKGGSFPVAERGLGQQAAAARRTTVEPGHLGAGAGLVDKDKFVGIDKGTRRCQMRRRAATSGRSCSLARSVFF